MPSAQGAATSRKEEAAAVSVGLADVGELGGQAREVVRVAAGEADWGVAGSDGVGSIGGGVGCEEGAEADGAVVGRRLVVGVVHRCRVARCERRGKKD